MHVFAQTASIEFLDALTCALIAAATFTRATIFRANSCGSLLLACGCGLFAPLARELVLHGSQGASLVMGALSIYTLAGALGALMFAFLLRARQDKLFNWLDGLSIGLMSAFCTCLCLPELKISGAMAVGIGCGLMPGLIRDVCLGDSAQLLEKQWYGASALAASLGAILVLLLPAFFTLPEFMLAYSGEWAVGIGALLALPMRLMAR